LALDTRFTFSDALFCLQQFNHAISAILNKAARQECARRLCPFEVRTAGDAARRKDWSVCGGSQRHSLVKL